VNVSEVLAIIAGIGCVYFYWQSKKNARDARETRMRAANAEADEIHKQAKELRDGIVIKKEEYEKSKLKVFAVVDGDKPESTDDGES
jgi:hypothetical protein